MESHKKKLFQFRAFVSLLTAFSFILAVLTGCILFITPPGRIANWTGWTFWGFDKHQWIALHIWFCLVFTIISLFHVYLNFKPIVNYLKITASQTVRFRFEWLAALAICGAVFAGTHYHVKPFSSLLVWQDSVKFGWEDQSRSAPAAHAELWTLRQLAEETGTDLEIILANLKTDSPDSTLAQLAEQTGRTPNQLYSIALGQPARSGGSGSRGGGGQGQGFGRMTLQQVCEQYGLDVDAAIRMLEEEGIEVEAGMTMRQIADRHNLHPSQLRSMLVSD